MRGFSLCSQTAATAKLHNESNLLAQKLHFGIAEQILDESLKLLPQLGTGGRLNFPPVDVPHHDLVAEGFKLGIG